MTIDFNTLVTSVLTSAVFSGIMIKIFSHYLDKKLLKISADIEVYKDIKRDRLNACKLALKLSARAKDICKRCVSLIAYTSGYQPDSPIPHIPAGRGSQDIDKSLDDNCQELKTTLTELEDVYGENVFVLTGESMRPHPEFELLVASFADDILKFKASTSKKDEDKKLLDAILRKYNHIEDEFNGYNETLKKYYKKYE